MAVALKRTRMNGRPSLLGSKAVPAIREGAVADAMPQAAGGGGSTSTRVPSFDLWNATWPWISANSV